MDKELHKKVELLISIGDEKYLEHALREKGWKSQSHYRSVVTQL